MGQYTDTPIDENTTDPYVWGNALWEALHEEASHHDTKTAGTVFLPGGVNVPVHRDGANGNGIIYKQQYLDAVAAAPRVPVVRLAQVEP